VVGEIVSFPLVGGDTGAALSVSIGGGAFVVGGTRADVTLSASTSGCGVLILKMMTETFLLKVFDQNQR